MRRMSSLLALCAAVAALLVAGSIVAEDTPTASLPEPVVFNDEVRAPTCEQDVEADAETVLEESTALKFPIDCSVVLCPAPNCPPGTKAVILPGDCCFSCVPAGGGK